MSILTTQTGQAVRSRAASVWLAVLIAVTAVAGGSAVARPAAPLRDRAAIFAALSRAEVLDGERQLIHLAHVCDLDLASTRIAVINVVEQVPGAAVPRAVRRIVLLDRRLSPVGEFGYTPALPLFCRGATLFFSEPVTLNNVMPEGNAVAFAPEGERIGVEEVRRIDPNGFPLPRTGARDFRLQ